MSTVEFGDAAHGSSVDGEDEPRLVAVGELTIGTPVTLPTTGASDFQDRLVGANRAVRVAALQRLDGFFPGYDFEAASQNADDRRFMVLAVPDELLDFLDGPGTVDRIVAEHEHRFAPGGVTFTRAEVDGHQPPPPGVARPAERCGPDWGVLEPGVLAAVLRAQWTVILNGSDRYDANLRSLCDDLMAVYGAPVNTNIYLAQGRAEGFGPHWDTHDTIIIQVQGRKEWSAYEPAVLSAEQPWISREISNRPLWSGTLEPGMALVVPRGWGHEVHDTDELSIHYTIGINRLEVHQLLERVSFEAGFWPVMRADVPYDVHDATESWGGSVFDDTDGLSRTVAELTTPELIDRAVGIYRARLRRSERSSLTGTFAALHHRSWDKVRLRMPVPAGVTIHHEDDDAAIVGFDDRAVRLATPCLDAFAELAAGEGVDVADLPAVIVDGEDRRSLFAAQLVELGVALVEPA